VKERRANAHERIDRINIEQDRLIASHLRKNGSALRIARKNLKRWMRRDKQPRPVFLEWNRVLTCLTSIEIADFLESDTPLARRLRQSSPFAGVLSEAERLSSLRRHDEA